MCGIAGELGPKIEPGAAVEGPHQPVNHRFVDARTRNDVLKDQIAGWSAGSRVDACRSLSPATLERHCHLEFRS